MSEDPKPESLKEEKENSGIRLNKFLANAGIASRRKSDELIAAGKVTVNGKVILEMGHRIQPDDAVEFEGKKITTGKKTYILLNKPKDYITTTSDERDRKTVWDLVPPARKEKLFPVGRLDRNTTGLLLLTNDGELTQQLTHPSHESVKIYSVVLDRSLREDDLEKISQGIDLEDGKAEVDEVAWQDPADHSRVGVSLHSGRNRVVRRIFEHLGYQVKALDRIFFAGLTKKNLPRGKWRFLSEQEIILLKHFRSQSKTVN